jgi:hypothetical protein
MICCKPYILLLSLTCFIAGCEKEIPWTFQEDTNSRLVVDGIISNEIKPQCIKLSHTNSKKNQGWQPVSGASVRVRNSHASYEFTESDSVAGYYYSEIFQAAVGDTFQLTITFESASYEASAEPVPVTPMQPAVYVKDDSTNLFRFNYTEEDQPSMTEVFYDWSSIPDYCTTYGNCYAQETFYSLNNVDVNELFSAPKQTIYFPAGTIFIRKKYSLSDAHQEFIRSLLMETDWSGGIFDVEHGNTKTNLSNGALGFFATCMVISDTTIVE